MGTSQSYALQYLTDTDERPEGYGGGAVGVGGAGGRESYIKAIDYKTGKVRWRHPLTEGGAMGLLSTAGDLLFGGDGSGNFVAYDPSTGDPLWHVGLGTSPSNMIKVLSDKELGPSQFSTDYRAWTVTGLTPGLKTDTPHWVLLAGPFELLERAPSAPKERKPPPSTCFPAGQDTT